MTQKLQHFLATSGRIHSNQYGFTPHRSTSDAVRKVIDFINEDKEERRNTCVVLLQVKSAFNNA